MVQIINLVNIVKEPDSEIQSAIALEFVLRALQLKANESPVTCPVLRRLALFYIRLRLLRMEPYRSGAWPLP